MASPSNEQGGHQAVDPALQRDLAAAAEAGNLEAVQALVQRGADASLTDPSGQSAMSIAAAHGHIRVVRALMQQGAAGVAPMLAAAGGGHAGVLFALMNAPGGLHQVNAVGPERETLLGRAAARGHRLVVVDLIEQGADVNQAGPKGVTPLLAAATAGHTPVVTELLSAGADPNVASADGETPMAAAARGGHERVISELTRCGGDPWHEGPGGARPLEAAAQAGQVEVVRHFHAQFPEAFTQDLLQTLLVLAARGGHRGLVVELLRMGAVIERPDVCSGDTAATAAVRGGQNVMFYVLVEDHGVQIDGRNRRGETPMLAAAREGLWEWVFNLLVEYRGDPNIPDHEGTTVLHVGAQEGSSIVNVLLPCGADPNMRDRAGRTPLVLAIMGGYGGVVEQLLQLDADPAVADNRQATALLAAIQHRRYDLAVRLASRMDAVELVWLGDVAGVTPLLAASILGAQEVAACLVGQGAPVNARDNNWTTPLMAAAGGGHLGVVQLLLGARADVAMVDRQGWDAGRHAAESGHEEVVAELRDARQGAQAAAA